MAYILSGSEGGFTISSGEAFYTALFGTALGAGLVTANQWTLAISSESKDITPLNATNFKALSGLRSYVASVSGFVYAIPRVGNVGLVQSASPAFYVTNARAWSIVMEPYAVHPHTSFHASVPASGPTWRSFRPDSILRWSGSHTCGVDTTTVMRTGASGTEPIQAPSITDDSATVDFTNLTLTYGDSAADESFSGAAQIVGGERTVRTGQRSDVVYNWVGSGPLAAAGTNILFTSAGISAGKVVAPYWGGLGTPLVAQFYDKTSATTRYYETVDMFWRRFAIICEVDQPVRYQMDFIGSGALTVN